MPTEDDKLTLKELYEKTLKEKREGPYKERIIIKNAQRTSRFYSNCVGIDRLTYEKDLLDQLISLIKPSKFHTAKTTIERKDLNVFHCERESYVVFPHEAYKVFDKADLRLVIIHGYICIHTTKEAWFQAYLTFQEIDSIIDNILAQINFHLANLKFSGSQNFVRLHFGDSENDQECTYFEDGIVFDNFNKVDLYKLCRVSNILDKINVTFDGYIDTCGTCSSPYSGFDYVTWTSREKNIRDRIIEEAIKINSSTASSGIEVPWNLKSMFEKSKEDKAYINKLHRNHFWE